MKRTNIVIAGNSFAGFTAAIELKNLVGYDHEITVIGKSHEFIFVPSLIWFPFGLRNEDDIKFDVRIPFQHKDIKFIEAEIVSFDPSNQRVWLHDEYINYDYLIIATGCVADRNSIPGIGPEKFSHCISNLHCAREARKAWAEYLSQGGPVVVGAAQGAAYFGTAYELLFNIRHQILKRFGMEKTELYFVTSEPFLGHLGIGGLENLREITEQIFREYKINWFTNTNISEIQPDKVILSDSTEIPSKYTTVIPELTGSDVVKNSADLGNKDGLVETNDEYRHHDYYNIYAAGLSVKVGPQYDTEVAVNTPRTCYPTEMMAKTAAWNIFADIYGLEKKSLPFKEINAYSILDAGNQGMMIIGDHMLIPKGYESLLPGPQAHWAKVAYEKYFMLSRSMGIVQ